MVRRWLIWTLGVALAVGCGANDGGDSTVVGGQGGGAPGGGSAASGGSGGAIITDGGGGGGPLGDAACAISTTNGERTPLDMYIVFDRSGSMTTLTQSKDSLWDATKQAFLSFASSPQSAGTGVGLQFFPPATTGSSSNSADCLLAPPPNCPAGCIPFLFSCVPDSIGEACSSNDYLPPAVFIEPLPAVKPKLEAALNGTEPAGGTPTVPAMAAAVQAVTGYAAPRPDRKVIIVLATDGNPNDCNSSISGVASEASKAVNANPPVGTFVIGINNKDVNTGGLDQIALAGGTNKALIVDPANAGAEFLQAILDIQTQALGCTFKVPAPPPGETLNPNKVNVWYTPEGGTPELIYKTGGAAQCDPTLGGWYFNDPAMPTEIELCPASCAAVGGTRGQVRIELGCSSVELPR